MAAENVRLSPYALLELEDITPVLYQPLVTTSRIKYTCFDVSRNLIVLGATSGGVYIFRRDPVEFLQLIPTKEGAITKLAVSSDEKHISFANGKGDVTVVERRQNAGTQTSNLVSKEHRGNEVTAMLWSSDPMLLYLGDDVGKISILQIPTLLTKTMFHSMTQVIMNLDSRICQIDITHCMLIISTLTRCYISHTEKEQYRQIGQKLRDGEYGVCFLTCIEHKNDGNVNLHNIKEKHEIKKYHVMTADDNFAVSDKLANTLIYCGRPSSRLWEASIDGTVKRTHQYKQVLGKPPSQPITQSLYQNEKVEFNNCSTESEGQSFNFETLHALKNCVIFTFKKDAIYFLDTEHVENTLWFDNYKDIADCKVSDNKVFLWHHNGTITSLEYITIEKYLLKCYLDEKYSLCLELCSIYSEYFISSQSLSPKLSILAGLKNKTGIDLSIHETHTLLLDKFASLKTEESTKMNSGIFIIDNTHVAKQYLEEGDVKESKDVKIIAPEAMQALKDLSNTVTDRFSSSKRKFQEKWDNLEDKIKSMDLPQYDFTAEGENRINGHNPVHHKAINTNENFQESEHEILYNSSQIKLKQVETNSNIELYKSLYKNYKLYEHHKADELNMCRIIDDHCCDMKEVHILLLEFEEFCKSIDIPDEDSKYISKSIFLMFVNASVNDDLLNLIIEDTDLYTIFVDACVFVNLKNNRISHSSCECGYPLPYTVASQTPLFCDLIDRFIEKQWASHTQTQCYEICKKMPYLWRKILFLRRNEDLLNILLLLLQMLDEKLLYYFLPQFTKTTWTRTIQLYSILSTNVCLNCNKKFENIDVKKTLSWDSLGLLLIKTVGGIDAIKVMKDHADLMEVGDLTLKFYHTCILIAKYEKYDGTIRNQLADTLYNAYDYEDSRLEICRLLRASLCEDVQNTSLPIVVASKSNHWGLNFVDADRGSNPEEEVHSKSKNITMEKVLELIESVTDCKLCDIPIANKVLMCDGGLWVFKCGHIFHRACLDLIRIKLCPHCLRIREI